MLTPLHLKPSAAIREAHYDAATRELHLEFHSGKSYTYTDVPAEKAQGLVDAESIGRYFGEHIRNGHSARRAA